MPVRRERTKHELRCFCRGAPLLAMYGVDPDGSLYVHVKIYKQGRVYGETYHKGGTVLIRCRNCFRFSRVSFVSTAASNLTAELVEASPPPAVNEYSPA